MFIIENFENQIWTVITGQNLTTHGCDTLQQQVCDNTHEQMQHSNSMF
jgi:hypothetical protein